MLSRKTLLAMQLLTLELKLDVFIQELELRYNPDQPRVPAGSSGGGQWAGAGGPQTRPIDDSQDGNPVEVAMAGELIGQRVGVGETGMIRHCIYQDMFLRQRTVELDATEICPKTYVFPPYYGPF